MFKWTLILSVYNYKLQYVPGKKISNADTKQITYRGYSTRTSILR